MSKEEFKKGQEVRDKRCGQMSRKRFHEIDGRDHFIPVEFIGDSNRACHVKISTNSGDKDLVVPYIYQLERPDEPQKPVIPKFVADWIESCKVSGFSLRLAMSHWSMSEKLDKWMEYSENQEIFAKAWFYGYTVEKPKLYTVEIPNPNRKGNNRFFLHKDPNTGKILLCKGNFNPEKNKNLWLTESEIRKDFEWAWQWAEPV